MLRRWIFYLKLLLMVGDRFSRPNIVLISTEMGQQNKECNPISTVPPLQNTASAPFPGNAVESEQLREFATGKSGLSSAKCSS